ncbi:sodium-coupled monocarboxylate transporter 2-like [Ornithodoros turicata]|uniref:sodium-coupled monocarboxylate transporter 2-like n=1 Tax=Ornithodoros turicata TaxID=34597 RepID=UPI00313870D1
MAVKLFSLADYAVLVALLGASALIGIFFAWKDRRNADSRLFLVGNRQLQLIPVTLSMMSNFLSSITILGIPAETFVHGAQFTVSTFAVAVAIFLAAEVVLPVFYKMDMISVNQYLQQRFQSVLLRKVASCLVIIQMCFFQGVVLYGPSLALGSVTGLPVWLSIVLNGTVCAFYTTIGGIKAVVWTDVLQMVLMISGFLLVIVKGSLLVGGIAEVFEIAKREEQLGIFDLSLDFQKTFTFWSVFFGSGIFWTMGYCINQAMVQRFCGLSTLSRARQALYLNMAGVIMTMLMSCFSGLVLYAVYYKCDPLKTSRIRKYDQLMPLLITDTFHHVPGVSGLFVAAVYSSSLSTMSSGFNALAALTWEDFLKAKIRMSPSRSLLFTKAIAAFYGFVTMAIAFMAGSLTSILQAAATTTGAFNGALGAIFFIGLAFPWCGKKTALASLIAGLTTSLWVAAGTLIYPTMPPVPRTTVVGCTYNFTVTEAVPKRYASGGIIELYHISYLWVPVISFVVTSFSAIAVTVMTGLRSANPEPELVTPCMRGLYKRSSKKATSTESADMVQKSSHRDTTKELQNGYSNCTPTENEPENNSETLSTNVSTYL